MIITTRILDGISTYLATPDLKYEQNIFVLYFGLGWVDFILLGVLFCFLTILSSHISNKYDSIFDIKASSLKYYTARLIKSKSKKGIKIGSTIIINKHSLVYFGQIFPYFLIYYSIFLIVNNMFIAGVNKYESMYTFYFKYIEKYNALDLLNIMAILSIFVFVLYFFTKKKFHLYNHKESI